MNKHKFKEGDTVSFKGLWEGVIEQLHESGLTTIVGNQGCYDIDSFIPVKKAGRLQQDLVGQAITISIKQKDGKYANKKYEVMELNSENQHYRMVDVVTNTENWRHRKFYDDLFLKKIPTPAVITSRKFKGEAIGVKKQQKV